ncbi:response regulator [Gynuella sunshinyii]|uniref:histidine kinase n=1 Tax=Gynuella sunshinyii YC6258 TaxID=1445510 RepID=A0A0C5VJV9_9GAMM|nr:response regulator [Gynuella sunshinyii]AJQ93663.1 signal transduction histidine kinase [Gynuella sunshinyii YC6258]
MSYRQQVCLILLLVAPLFSWAGNIDITTLQTPVEIWDFAERLTTPRNTTVEDIANSHNWKSVDRETPGRGFSKQTEWLRFNVSNSSDQKKRMRFFWHHAQIGSSNIYLRDTKTGDWLPTIHLSSLTPIEDRPYRGRMLEWYVDLPANSEYQLLLSAESNFSMSFRILAGNEADLGRIAGDTYNSTYLFIGFILALVLYNAALALSTKESGYWFYIFYITMVSLYTLSLRGFLFEWHWYSDPIWEQRVVLFLAPLSLIFALLFADNILRIKYQPALFKFVFRFCLFAQFIMLAVAAYPSIDIFVSLFAPLSIVVVVFMLSSSAWVILHKGYYAILFFLGWLALLLGIAGHQYSIIIGVGTELLGRESLKTGTALEAIFLSWAMALRVQRLRKEHEALRKQHTQSLQEMNEQLADKLELEQELNNQKNELLNIISHELKTPLNIVYSAIDLLRENPSSEHIRDLAYGSDRLRRNVDNLVLLSELNTQKLRVNYQYFSIQNLLSALNETAEVTRKADQQWKLISNVSPEYRIYSDERLLTILLENIVENAFKFSPRGIIKAVVWVETTNGQDDRMIWNIEDDGIGIPEDKQTKVFDLFFQMDHGKTRGAEGMGIGLPLAAEIIKRLYGKITLESIPHKGTLVHLEYPSAAPNLEQQRVPIGLPGNKERCVLVVEDNHINAKVLVRLMEQMHYQVVIADNGAKAVDLAANRHFDLILMDIQMPVMDGFEATRQIRALGFEGIIIAITANDTSEDRNNAQQSGMDDFLGKPIRFQQLKTKLRSFNL